MKNPLNQRSLTGIALAALTIGAMHYVCLCDFISLDDPLYVTTNPHVLSGLNWPNLTWAFTDSCTHSGFFYPTTWLSLQLDATLFGGNGAGGFHATNLLIHVASVLLFFLALQRMTGDLWRSAAAAALFGIHPLRVESVAWVTERKDVLGTLFLFLTLTAWCWYVERPSWRRYALVFAIYTIGLTAKVTLITLPFALLLLDYWPLYRLQLGQTMPPNKNSQPSLSWQRLVVEKLGLLMASMSFAGLDLYLLGRLGSVHSVEALPLVDRVAIAATSYLTYLAQTLWPANLAVLYPFNAAVSFPHAAFSLAVMLALTAGAFVLRRRLPALIVGWLWFVGTMIPLSGLVQIGPQLVADRFTYIPHIGLMIAFVWGISSLPMWQRLSAKVHWIAAGAVIAALAALTWLQTFVWQDSELLFLHALRSTSNNHTIHAGLSGYYSRQDNLDFAIRHAKEALRVHPSHEYQTAYAALLVRGEAYQQAAEQLQQVLKQQPNSADANYFLGVAEARLGNLASARRHLQRALELWQSTKIGTLQFDTFDNTVAAHILLGGLILRDNDPQAALDHFTTALRLKPETALAHEWMGIALSKLGRWSDAETHFRQTAALQQDPSKRAWLAYALARQGKKDEAAKEYEQLLRAAPDWPSTASKFAVDSTASGEAFDLHLAEMLAEQACEASRYKLPAVVDNLARVYAARGDFAKAKETVLLAITLETDAKRRADMQTRLEQYKNGKIP